MSRQLFVFVLLVLANSPGWALSLGPDEFAAAERLTCVLAQQSLGYLSEDEYAEQTDQVLGEYEQGQSDVIYAKALGYYHGLMFGLDESDERQVSGRTQLFLNSQACTLNANVRLGLPM